MPRLIVTIDPDMPAVDAARLLDIAACLVDLAEAVAEAEGAPSRVLPRFAGLTITLHNDDDKD